jgi:hypothetical protein
MKVIMMGVILVAGLTLGAKAQRNSVLVYGNAGISTANDVSTMRMYSFRPGIGYQFTDHLTAGVNIGVWGEKNEIGSSGKYTTTHNFEAGPFLRYTHSLTDLFSLYGQCDVNYQHSTTKDESTNTTVTQNGFVSRIWPAIGVNIKNGFGLNFKFGEISYTYGKVKGGGSSNAFLADFNWTTGFQFGISKNFPIHKR